MHSLITNKDSVVTPRSPTLIKEIQDNIKIAEDINKDLADIYLPSLKTPLPDTGNKKLTA